MKKYILLALLSLCLGSPAFSESLYDSAGDRLEEYRFQVSFAEKYFEYMGHYRNYNIFQNSVHEYETPSLMHRGLLYDMGFKMGLPGEYVAGVEVKSIFQELDKTEANSVQTIALLLRKYFGGGAGLMAGVRLAIDQNLPAEPRLINEENKKNLILGLFYKPDLGMFNLKIQASGEQPFFSNPAYTGEFELTLLGGLVIYDDKTEEKISLNTELVYHGMGKDKTVSTYALIVPQLSVYFYDSLTFILGVDILAYANEVYINRYDKYLYTFKFSYNVSAVPSEKNKK